MTEKRVEQRDIGLSGIAVSPDRMRVLRPEVVKELSNSMRKQGLLQPILLRPTPGVGNGFFLIAGAHRYHAAKKLGWKHIPARIFHGWGDDEAILAEIDENLCRADLTASQRAKFTAARKKVYLKAHPQTGKGGDRQSATGKQSAKLARSFVAETAAKTGKPTRTIERDVTRGERLGPDLDRVAGTSLDKGAELDALAAMSAETRDPIIQRAAAGEEVSAIRAAAQQEPKPGYSALRTAWLRASAAGKAAFVSEAREEIEAILGKVLPMTRAAS